MLSTFGTLNATLLTAPRIFFAMADDGLFFRRVASGASAVRHAVRLDRARRRCSA